jgi:hypothetical protein
MRNLMDSNSDVENNIELQLSELEMLGSMFPNKGELELIDPGVISDLHDFLSGKLGRDKVPKLEYNINLNIIEVRIFKTKKKYFFKLSSIYRQRLI